MQCEKCQERKATVHLKRKSKAPRGGPDNVWLEHHLCEECFRVTPELNPGYSAFSVDESLSGDMYEFSYAWQPGHRAETVRVVSKSAEKLVLRVVRSETGAAEEDWVFFLERLPGPWQRWPIGKEVQLSLTKAAFEWLQGRRETYE